MSCGKVRQHFLTWSNLVSQVVVSVCRHSHTLVNSSGPTAGSGGSLGKSQNPLVGAVCAARPLTAATRIKLHGRKEPQIELQRHIEAGYRGIIPISQVLKGDTKARIQHRLCAAQLHLRLRLCNICMLISASRGKQMLILSVSQAAVHKKGINYGKFVGNCKFSGCNVIEAHGNKSQDRVYICWTLCICDSHLLYIRFMPAKIVGCAFMDYDDPSPLDNYLTEIE